MHAWGLGSAPRRSSWFLPVLAPGSLSRSHRAGVTRYLRWKAILFAKRVKQSWQKQKNHLNFIIPETAPTALIDRPHFAKLAKSTCLSKQTLTPAFQKCSLSAHSCQHCQGPAEAWGTWVSTQGVEVPVSPGSGAPGGKGQPYCKGAAGEAGGGGGLWV